MHDVVPQAELLALLEASGIGETASDGAPPAEPVGTDDCSITPTAVKGVWLAQTTDFFYPLVDDPYVMGKIACANVLSDLYAVGVVHCDTMLMLLGVSTQLADSDVRRVATTLCMRGFRDLAAAAGTRVTGGQTVRNPWYLVGGVASAVVAEAQLIRPVNALPGDVLAVASMARLNQNAAKLMHKYGAHAATDVTGFGLLGHASNLAAGQDASVDFVIHTMPLLPHALALDKVTCFGLDAGKSPETSGGLLVALPADVAAPFLEELSRLDGWSGCVVGDVVEGTGKARLLAPDQLTFRTIECVL
ncbi:AIR synthase-related protein [Syncephalis pseudoplumigaleata]|uniref:AIR synthase-related protein n=1 Tax=Syncephalis pseudoplumigaleata TaxID=1712513 RepID=A0A4P9Z7L7_9FUNG|nr:AIR synthase-related protein [Syncephalis pseudoplumigaleata]|eukprot:RKP28202.1 AIR synthase-related protein [Syncephalis pseudoplumigaleata]